jgi:hypothetical protein
VTAIPSKHLDSRFVGLANESQDDAARLDDASRRAFNNLIALAIEEECRLIVIADTQMAVKLVNAGGVPPSLRRRIPQLSSRRIESAQSEHSSNDSKQPLPRRAALNLQK